MVPLHSASGCTRLGTDNYEEISKYLAAGGRRLRVYLSLHLGAQPFELKATEVTVEADSLSDYPLQKKRHTMEYLEKSHICPRSNTFSAVFRVRSIVGLCDS